MDKKIGILTFHRSLNYGAVLQAYGLVKAIEKLGYSCEIIDYRNSFLEDRDSIKRFIKTKEITRAIYQYLEFPFWIIRRRRFNKFLKSIGVSSRVLQIDSSIEKKYYKLFVGSDQVWNYKITGLDQSYFFSKITDVSKKNSYAASFGISSIPQKFQKYYIDGLNSFNKISVRELQGATIISELIGKEAKVVLDPSLLLTSEEWQSLIRKTKIKNDYVLIYQRAYSKSLIEFAKRLAKRTNCKIVTINGNPRQPINAKYVLTAGPIEWLNLMLNAKYIVTNSFHGVAFSINFNKDFFVELLDEKFGVNSRLENIINFFDLESRKINNKYYKDLKKIDYKVINKKLEQARLDSLEFLKNALDV